MCCIWLNVLYMLILYIFVEGEGVIPLKYIQPRNLEIAQNHTQMATAAFCLYSSLIFGCVSAFWSGAVGLGPVDPVLFDENRRAGEQSVWRRHRVSRPGLHHHRRRRVYRVVLRLLRSYSGKPLHDYRGKRPNDVTANLYRRY